MNLKYYTYYCVNKTKQCDKWSATQKEEKNNIMKNKPTDIQIQIKKKALHTNPYADKTDEKNQYDVLFFCQRSSTRHLDPIIFI